MNHKRRMAHPGEFGSQGVSSQVLAPILTNRNLGCALALLFIAGHHPAESIPRAVHPGIPGVEKMRVVMGRFEIRRIEIFLREPLDHRGRTGHGEQKKQPRDPDQLRVSGVLASWVRSMADMERPMSSVIQGLVRDRRKRGRDEFTSTTSHSDIRGLRKQSRMTVLRREGTPSRIAHREAETSLRITMSRLLGVVLIRFPEFVVRHWRLGFVDDQRGPEETDQLAHHDLVVRFARLPD